MWDLIVSVPDHCLSFYFSENAALIQWPFLNMTNAKLIRS